MELLDEENKISGLKMIEGIGVAAAVGILVGILFTIWARKKTRGKIKIASGDMILEVNDLEKFRIERIE